MAYYGFGEDIGWTIDGVNYIDFEAPKPIQIRAGLTDEKEILAAYFEESQIREYEKNIREQIEAKLGRGIVDDRIIRDLAEIAYRDKIKPKIEININNV